MEAYDRCSHVHIQKFGVWVGHALNTIDSRDNIQMLERRLQSLVDRRVDTVVI